MASISGGSKLPPIVNPPFILIIEDTEDDAFLMQRAFQRAKIINGVRILRSGEQAVEYLSGAGKFTDRIEDPLPGLILLDLKMPGIDGFEVLRWIRRDPGLAGVRVVVLTSSTDVRDVILPSSWEQMGF